MRLALSLLLPSGSCFTTLCSASSKCSSSSAVRAFKGASTLDMSLTSSPRSFRARSRIARRVNAVSTGGMTCSLQSLRLCKLSGG